MIDYDQPTALLAVFRRIKLSRHAVHIYGSAKKPNSPSSPHPMEQRVEEPTIEDLSRMERHREWVKGHFEPASQPLYEEYEQKLRLLDTIIQNGWIAPSETWKLQSLGITLGDAFVQRCGFEWVSVEDEYGRDPALRITGTTIILYPLTMISKRIEKGESVDVYSLIDGVAQKAYELKSRFQQST